MEAWADRQWGWGHTSGMGALWESKFRGCAVRLTGGQDSVEEAEVGGLAKC